MVIKVITSCHASLRIFLYGEGKNHEGKGYLFMKLSSCAAAVETQPIDALWDLTQHAIKKCAGFQNGHVNVVDKFGVPEAQNFGNQRSR